MIPKYRCTFIITFDYFMHLKKISQYLPAPSLLRLVTCVSVQYQTYLRTYISASHLAAVAGELYCVCELYSEGAALALVSYLCKLNQQPVNGMVVSINCYMIMYIQTWIHHKSTKGKTSRTICMGSSWSWNPASFAWKAFSLYSQLPNKNLKYCSKHHYSDDGSRKHFWNVSKLLLDYMLEQPTRQPSSCLKQVHACSSIGKHSMSNSKMLCVACYTEIFIVTASVKSCILILMVWIHYTNYFYLMSTWHYA
jgi:hypothetical protein